MFGYRLLAMGYRQGAYALNFGYVVARGRGVIKRQLMSILFVNYRQFFSICGLEECETHISNPQIRGWFARQSRGLG